MTAPISFPGLGTGLNVTQIINAELSMFEQPLNQLEAQQASVNTQLSDYQTINSEMLSLQQAGDALANPSAFNEAYSVSSTDSTAATGTITGASSAGSISFIVNQLATGSTLISAGTVSATNDVVASGNYLVGSGGAAIGIGSFTGTSSLAAGSHSISVTQASAGASTTGSSTVPSSVSITSTNDTITANINGVATTVTIANGTYSPTQLAQAITGASGGTLNASINSSGNLVLTTTQQGSSASLQITGGTALSSIGIATTGTLYGINGIINVDGYANTITNISGSGTTAVTLTSGTGGTISASLLSSGLSMGSMLAANVSVGNGSLASVVSAINAANVGVTANALQVGTNSYALEITSNSTGLAGAATVDTQAFTGSSLGAINTSIAAQNAEITVGGTSGTMVTSSTNQIKGLLPGLTANISQVSSSPVTLTVSADGSQMTSQVQALVDAANKVLSTIAKDTAYDQSTNTAAPLNGQTGLNALAQQVLAFVGNIIGKSTAGSDGTAGESAGLAITSSGTITFNSSAFVTAYDANPSAVQSMFTVGGTFAPSASAYTGEATVAGASNYTMPGTYAVTISRSASQAIDTGSVTFSSSSSTLASAETYTITSGGLTASYAATAGETVANVISGINAATASAGIGVAASLVGASGSYQVQLTSADYGSGASFGVSASGTDQLGLTTSGSSYSGVDVAGTINGVAATGNGQMLTLNATGNAANGLSLQITTPGITSSTALGNVTYSPGIGQGLANLAEQAILPPGGEIAASISGLNSSIATLNSQIQLQKQLVATEKAMLDQEFSNMAQLLAQINSQGQFLSQSSGSSPSSSSAPSGG